MFLISGGREYALLQTRAYPCQGPACSNTGYGSGSFLARL